MQELPEFQTEYMFILNQSGHLWNIGLNSLFHEEDCVANRVLIRSENLKNLSLSLLFSFIPYLQELTFVVILFFFDKVPFCFSVIANYIFMALT